MQKISFFNRSIFVSKSGRQLEFQKSRIQLIFILSLIRSSTIIEFQEKHLNLLYIYG